MSRDGSTELLALVLLLALGMLYLEWWRSGELEDLNRRVDELDERTKKKTAAAVARQRRPRTEVAKDA